jgi:predicted Zn-dependent peptidase
MARYVISVIGKGLQQKGIDKLVQSLKEKDGVSVSVTKVEPPTSRAARLDAAISQVEDGKSAIEELRDELQEWYDNLPENFQNGDKGEQLQSAIDGLEELIDGLDVDGSSVEFPGMFG